MIHEGKLDATALLDALKLEGYEGVQSVHVGVERPDDAWALVPSGRAGYARLQVGRAWGDRARAIVAALHPPECTGPPGPGPYDDEPDVEAMRRETLDALEARGIRAL